MNDILDLSDYLQFIAALGVVILLITVIAAAGKRFLINQAGGVPRGKTRRLSMIESLPIDARRRVLLVRRDDVEHLVLLGLDKDTVIETGILPPERDSAASPHDPQQTEETAETVDLGAIRKLVDRTSSSWSSTLAQRIKGRQA